MRIFHTSSEPPHKVHVERKNRLIGFRKQFDSFVVPTIRVFVGVCWMFGVVVGYNLLKGDSIKTNNTQHPHLHQSQSNIRVIEALFLGRFAGDLRFVIIIAERLWMGQIIGEK